MRTTYMAAGQAVALDIDGGEWDGVYFIHGDHLGSAQLMTYGEGHGTPFNDVTGTYVSGTKARYLPFGGSRTAPEYQLSDRGFTGHRHNDDLGLIYMNARFYVPEIGRFASADTFSTGSPGMLNRYAYVLNNPLAMSDPSGHCPYRTVNHRGSEVTERDISTQEGAACWEQFDFFVDNGAPQNVLEQYLAPDYLGRDDYHTLKAIFLQTGISLSFLTQYEWKMQTSGELVTVCADPSSCDDGYVSFAINDLGGIPKALLARSIKDPTGDFEKVFIMFSQGKRSLIFEKNALEYISAINNAYLEFDEADAQNQMGLLSFGGGAFFIGAAGLLAVATVVTGGSALIVVGVFTLGGTTLLASGGFFVTGNRHEARADSHLTYARATYDRLHSFDYDGYRAVIWTLDS